MDLRIGAGAALWERKHRGEKGRKIRREKEREGDSRGVGASGILA